VNHWEFQWFHVAFAFSENVARKRNRCFYQCLLPKTLHRLKAACLDEFSLEPFIVVSPQHRDGEFLAIWRHDPREVVRQYHTSSERPALRRNAWQSCGHRRLQCGSRLPNPMGKQGIERAYTARLLYEAREKHRSVAPRRFVSASSRRQSRSTASSSRTSGCQRSYQRQCFDQGRCPFPEQKR